MSLRQTILRRWQTGQRARLGRPRLRGRLDIGLGTILAAGGLCLVAMGWIAAYTEDARGFLDPPLVQPVPDRRILSDFRGADAPFADAALTDDALFVAREDGSVYRYDPAGELFSDEQIPMDEAGLTGAIALLAEACGRAPGADLAGCVRPETLLALTDRGGVALRDGGWETVLSDQAWTGTDGQLVQQEAVTAWAESDDGRHVLAHATGQGLGLFDQQTARWTSIAWPGQQPRRLIFAQGSFWLAGADGLSRVDRQSANLNLVEGLGDYLDLDRLADGSVLGIRRGVPCATCLSIVEVDPRAELRVLVGETEVSAGLSSARLHRVAKQSGRFVVAGSAGVHAYDPQTRSWQALASGEVQADWVDADGTRLVVAIGRQVITVEGGTIARTQEVEEPLGQIALVGGRILGLDGAGRVLDLTPVEPQVLVPVDPPPPPGTRFDTAAARGNLLVALGPSGILLHEVAQRRLAFQPASALPPEVAVMRDPRLLATDAAMWLVDRQNGTVLSVSATGDWPAVQATFMPVVWPQPPALPLASAQVGPSGVMLTDNNGAVWAATPQATVLTPLQGAPLSGTIRPVAVAGAGDILFLTDGQSLWWYATGDRSWSGPFALDFGEDVADIARTPDALLALTRSGGLWRLDADETWESVSGVGIGAALGLSDVTDARADGGSLLFGGNGVVARYSPADRAFIDSFTGGSGDVRIVGGDGTRPIWLSDGVLRRAGQVISAEDVTVRGAWLGPDGPVLLEAPAGGGPLHLRNLQSDLCLFRGNSPPKGTVDDARLLPDGRLVVLASGQLSAFSPDLRRWLTMGNSVAADRMAILNGHLLLLGDTSFRAVPLDQIPAPASCYAGLVDIKWAEYTGFAAVTVDEGNARLHLLGSDGAVSVWQAGSLQTLLAAPTTGPEKAEWHRAWPAGSALAVATKGALWRYDMARRIWTRTEFRSAPWDLTEVSAIGLSETAATVTVWGSDGAAYGAVQQGDALDFAPLDIPEWPVFKTQPSAIRDIVERGGQVAVLSLDRLEFAGNVSADIDLPPAERWIGTFARSGLTALVEGTDAGDALAFNVFTDAPTSGPVAPQSWRYEPGADKAWAFVGNALWRIDANLALWQCDIAAGVAVPAGCKVQTGAPMDIATDDVVDALPDKAQGTVLIYRAGPEVRLARLDPGLRDPTAIPGPLVDAEARLMLGPEGRVLVLDRKGGTLWSLDEGAAEAVVTDAARAIRTAAGLYIGTPAGLVRISDDDGVDPPDPALIIDGAGQPIQAAASQRIDLPGGTTQIRPRAPVATVPLDLQSSGQPGGPSGPAVLIVGDNGEVAFYYAAPCIGQPPENPRLCTRKAMVATLADKERLMMVETATDKLTLRTTLRDISFNTADFAATTDQPAKTYLNPSNFELGARADLVGQITAVDGRSVLAPPSIRQSGALNAVISTGTRTIASDGVILPDRWGPWAIAGVAWDKPSRQITFGTAATKVGLPVEQAIVRGSLLPALPGRGAFLGNVQWSWLNEAGLWKLEGGTVSAIAVQPFAQPVALWGDRFVLADGQAVDIRSGAASPLPTQEAFALGGLTVTTLQLGQAGATTSVGGQDVDALSGQGFLMDQRLGIGGRAGQTVLLTPIGLFPTDTFAGAQVAAAGTDLLANEGADLLARTVGGWLRLAGSGWATSDPPDHNRPLAEESGRRWQRVAGVVGVVAIDPTQGWRVQGSGIDLDANRLVALAASPAALVAVTGLGTETAASVADLAALKPPVAADPGAVALDALAVTPGDVVLWAQTPAGPLAWDAAAQSWRAPDPARSPWQARLAIAGGPVIMGFDGGLPWARVAVAGPNGQGAPADFSWGRAEEMPFDTVTALHVEGDRLVLGTRFGLRLLDGVSSPTDLGLFAPVAGQGPNPVRRVGRPLATPDRLLADTAGGCLDATSPGAPQPCADAGGLATRQALATGFWIWTETDDAATGRYQISDGSFVNIPAAISGAFPHDIRADSARCGGTTYEVWQTDDVVMQVAGAFRLDRVAGASALHCQQETIPLGAGEVLSEGIYLLSNASAYATTPSGGWAAVTIAPAEAARLRKAGGMPFDAYRLRYALLGDGALQPEYRWQSDRWSALAGQNGAGQSAWFSMDQITGLTSASGNLAVLTPAGAFLRPGGALDPDTLLLALPQDPAALKNCVPDRIETMDGQEQAVPAAAGTPMRFRCADGRVFQGTVTGPADLGALSELAEDPLTDRVLFQDDLWQWARVDSSPGQKGTLSIRFRDLPLALDGGRFDIDSYASLSGPFADMVELVSGKGWWRHNGLDLALPSGTQDPALEEAKAASAVSADRSDTGERVLCLQGSVSRQLDPAGQWRDVAACRDITGHGQGLVWAWYATAAGPLAETMSRNGFRLERRIMDGRFYDLIATGAALWLDDDWLLVPTLVGGIVLGSGRVRDIYASSEAVLPVRAEDGGLMLLGPADSIPVSAAAANPECTALALVMAALPETAVPVKTARHSAAVMTLTVEQPVGRLQILVDCAASAPASGAALGKEWTALADVSDHTRLAAHSATWPSANPVIALSFRDGSLTAEAGGSPLNIVTPPLGNVPLSIGVDLARKSAFVLTTEDLFVVDMDHLITEIATDLSTDPPAGPSSSPQPAPVPAEPILAPPADPSVPTDPTTVPTPPPAAALAPTPTPIPSPPAAMTEDTVRDIQTALTQLGYNPGPVDGLMGRQTEGALSAWRQENGLPPSDPMTEADLARLLPDRSI